MSHVKISFFYKLVVCNILTSIDQLKKVYTSLNTNKHNIGTHKWP